MITPLNATRMEQETRAAYPVLIDKIARDVAATLVVLKKTDDLLTENFSPEDKREHWELIEDRILVAARAKKGVKVRDLARVGVMARALVRVASMEPWGPCGNAQDRAEREKPKKSVIVPRPEGMSLEDWDRAVEGLKEAGIEHTVENEAVKVMLPEDEGEADKLVEKVAAKIFSLSDTCV